MSALADLQRDFAGAVRGQSTVGDIDIAGAGLAAERRIAIYRNHHRISLAGALAANFATVAALLGTSVFDGAAMSFIAAAPPAEPCLSAYGAGFPAFLDSEPDLEVVGCSDAKAQYIVLAKIKGNYSAVTAESKCEEQAKDFQYSYTESGDGSDFLLCLKDK